MSLGFLSAVIDSTSRGLIHGNAPPGLTSTCVPSTMNSGPSDASLNEVGPIMRTMMPPLGPGVTDTPDSFPASVWPSARGAASTGETPCTAADGGGGNAALDWALSGQLCLYATHNI